MRLIVIHIWILFIVDVFIIIESSFILFIVFVFIYCLVVCLIVIFVVDNMLFVVDNVRVDR